MAVVFFLLITIKIVLTSNLTPMLTPILAKKYAKMRRNTINPLPKNKHKKSPSSGSNSHLTGIFILERIMGVEPTTSAWEANVLPINYIRITELSGSPVNILYHVPVNLSSKYRYKMPWKSEVIRRRIFPASEAAERSVLSGTPPGWRSPELQEPRRKAP